MVLRRAAKVVGDTMDVNTGSSLYSRIGITHISTAYFRMTAGSTVAMRAASQRCCVTAWSRRGPKGRCVAGDWAVAPETAITRVGRTNRYVCRIRGRGRQTIASSQRDPTMLQ